MHGRFVEFVLHINRPENDRRIQIFTFLTCTRPLSHKQDTSVLYYNTRSLSESFIHFFFFFQKTRENVSPSAAERFRFYSYVLQNARAVVYIQDKRYQHYVFVSFDISFLVSPVFSYPLPVCIFFYCRKTFSRFPFDRAKHLMDIKSCTERDYDVWSYIYIYNIQVCITYNIRNDY